MHKTTGNNKWLDIHLQILLILYKKHDFKNYLTKLEEIRKINDMETEWEKRTKIIIYESMGYMI